MCQALLSERGEVSGARLATQGLTAYASLDDSARDALFDGLADDFSPDPQGVCAAANAYRDSPSAANLISLQTAVEPPRQELFRRLNTGVGGTRVLVEMRRRLLRALPEHPQWAAVDSDLLHLFRSWFNRGFLVLSRIDWRTSASILERLIAYEAVHEIQGWRDLRRRLEADRRCYAFFHPALPDEPLIFIEVALTRALSVHVQPLLDPDSPVVDPAAATHAIFYSITNCQEGLRGVSVGNFLIKQVVEDLGREFPRLTRFATLSPIPGFRRWARTTVDRLADDRRAGELGAFLEKVDDSDGPGDTPTSTHLQKELRGLCAYYLLHTKHGNAPLDPVARFHLANGARLERLNWAGDTSRRGIRDSFGLMVNYVYELALVERNHEAYARDGLVAASAALQRLAQQSLATTAVRSRR